MVLRNYLVAGRHSAAHLQEKNLATPHQQLVHQRHYLERIGNVHHVRLAARPTAVRVQRNCSAFADESPAYNVRLFAMAARRQSLGMPRCRSSLPHLVHVGEEGKYRLPIAALVDK